jgi:uncharacterized protein YecE (DUF72 family)
MKSSLPLYSGTSSIVVPNKQVEYPSQFTGASRLTYYASLFSSVEINSSFYRVPKTSTVAKWSESVPVHLRFTLKVPKAVTHSRGLQFSGEDVERFSEAAAGAGEKGLPADAVATVGKAGVARRAGRTFGMLKR